MNLTSTQKATLKSDILADGSLSSLPNNDAGNALIAAAYNAVASPNYWAFRTDLTRAVIYHEIGPEGTTWSWTTYKNQQVAEQNAWVQMFMGDLVNFSKPNLRAGVDAIFSGSGAPASQRAHVAAMGRRQATRVEKLFAAATAGGAGQRGSTGNPDTLTLEGAITATDVEEARNL